jgi:hypothetical protein
VFAHFLGGALVDAAMSGQNPFEPVGEQFLHRARLFAPGVPAGVAKGQQGVTL